MSWDGRERGGVPSTFRVLAFQQECSMDYLVFVYDDGDSINDHFIILYHSACTHLEHVPFF